MEFEAEVFDNLDSFREIDDNTVADNFEIIVTAPSLEILQKLKPDTKVIIKIVDM